MAPIFSSVFRARAIAAAVSLLVSSRLVEAKILGRLKVSLSRSICANKMTVAGDLSRRQPRMNQALEKIQRVAE
jgi:hypothetical protein